MFKVNKPNPDSTILRNMDQLFAWVLTVKYLKVILGIFLLIFAASCWQRFIHGDDLWLSEPSYYLAKEGIMKIPSIRGFVNIDTEIVAFHKLHIFIGALVVKIFGWSVYYLKTITLLVYAGFFLAYYRYQKRSENFQFDQPKFLFTSLLILFCPQMIIYGYIFRPEILVMTLGFLSYIILEFNLGPNKFSGWLLGGVFAGLAVITHMNGLVFPLAAFVWLIVLKKYRALLPLCMGAGAAMLLYTYNLWSMEQFDLFLTQVQYWPHQTFHKQLEGGPLGILGQFITKLFTEHKRYFRNENWFVFSALFWLSFVYSFRDLKRQKRPFFVYLIILMICLALFTSHKAPRYLIYIYPYMALVIAHAIWKINLQKANLLKPLILFALVLQLAFVSEKFTRIFKKNGEFASYHHRMLGSVPDKSARILATWDVIFNEIDKFDLVTYFTYEFHIYNLGYVPSQIDLLKKIHQDGVDYIIFDKVMLDQFNLHYIDHLQFKKVFFKGILKENPYYKIYKQAPDFWVYERIN